jgi:hypothetical protein
MKKSLKYLLFPVFMTAVFSCSEDVNPLNVIETGEINSEIAAESAFEDIDGMLSNVSFAGDVNFSSRIESLDDRFCAGTQVKLRNKVKTDADSLIIDFGAAGCTDPRGNVRKGKIVMIFTGDRKVAHTTTFVDFFFNGKKMEGTRSFELTNLVPPTFETSLSGGKITWPDGTFATREASHVRVWNPDLQQPSNSSYVIKKGGTATGVKRTGRSYAIEITKDLLFKRICMEPPLRISMPVEGTKIISSTNAAGTDKLMTVDFGDGACDRKITVTVDGNTKEVTVDND